MYGLVLALSLLFFLYKGVYYLILGSYVPLVLILAIIALLLISSRKSEKSFKRIVGLWAILTITWALVRLILGLTSQFVKPIPESHVAEQLGIAGAMLSLMFLCGGIYLWRHKNRIVEKTSYNQAQRP